MSRLESEPRCPNCAELVDGYTALDGGISPLPGDVTICAYCEEISVFTDSMDLTIVPKHVMNQIDPETIERARDFIIATKLRKDRKLH